MEKIDRIKALTRVWKQRAKDLKKEAEPCTDFIKKTELLATAAACKKHASEIKNLLDRK